MTPRRIVLGSVLAAAVLLAGWQAGIFTRTGAKALAGAPSARQSAQLEPRVQAPALDSTALAQANAGWQDQLQGTAGDGSYRTRLAGAQAMMARGRAEDIEAMYRFMAQAQLPDGLSTEEWNGLKNVFMDDLVENDPSAERLEAEFLKLAGDPHMEPTTRDYAVQHFDGVLERTGRPAPLVAVLAKCVAVPEGSLPGTALMALGRFADQSQGITREEVSKLVLQVLQNAKAGAQAQVAALQIAARWEMTAARPMARTLCRHFDASIPVRLSALHLLGAVGDAGDLEYLVRLAKAGEYPTGRAAQRSCEQLSAKLNHQSQGQMP